MEIRKGIDGKAAGRIGALAPLCAGLLFVSLFAPTASANTSVFSDTRTCNLTFPNCQSLSLFGVLNGTTADTMTMGGGWTFNSGIGIGTTSELTKTGANTANGIVDFSDAVVTNSSCSGSNNFCGAGTLSGSTPVRNATLVNAAESQLDTILTALATSTFNTGNGASTSLATTGTLNVAAGLSGGTLKVYRNSAAYTQTGAVTLGCGGVTCSSSMLVVIKMTGGTVTLNRDFLLADGLTSDQVIFYVPSNNLAISPTAAAITVNADFFLAASSGAYGVGCTSGACDPVTFNGRIFADNGALTFNNKGGTFGDQGPSPIPEPGTWALMAGGLAAGAWLARRRAAQAKLSA